MPCGRFHQSVVPDRLRTVERLAVLARVDAIDGGRRFLRFRCVFTSFASSLASLVS